MKKLKILLLILMIYGTTFLSSCLFPGPEYGSHGGNYERHENHGHHDRDDHRDNDDHHDK
jgi:hypothetical protein